MILLSSLLSSLVRHNTCSVTDAYDQGEYLALMDKFDKEKIPMSVAVVHLHRCVCCSGRSWPTEI